MKYLYTFLRFEHTTAISWAPTQLHWQNSIYNLLFTNISLKIQVSSASDHEIMNDDEEFNPDPLQVKKKCVDGAIYRIYDVEDVQTDNKDNRLQKGNNFRQLHSQISLFSIFINHQRLQKINRKDANRKRVVSNPQTINDSFRQPFRFRSMNSCCVTLIFSKWINLQEILRVYCRYEGFTTETNWKRNRNGNINTDVEQNRRYCYNWSNGK